MKFFGATCFDFVMFIMLFTLFMYVGDSSPENYTTFEKLVAIFMGMGLAVLKNMEYEFD